MIAYISKKEKIRVDIFPHINQDDFLLVYIQNKNVHCKLECVFETETARFHYKYKNRKYTLEELQMIQQAIYRKFDFVLEQSIWEKNLKNK